MNSYYMKGWVAGSCGKLKATVLLPVGYEAEYKRGFKDGYDAYMNALNKEHQRNQILGDSVMRWDWTLIWR